MISPFFLGMKIGSVVLMESTSKDTIKALAISSIYSYFTQMEFGLLLNMLGHWCCDQVGREAGASFLKRHQQ